ncbi:hypothetical protein D3C84_579860 [compost metagenome]
MLHIQGQRTVGVVLHAFAVLGAEGIAVEVVGREEMLRVVHRQRPEAIRWRRLAFGKCQGVAMIAMEALALLVHFKEEVAGFLGLIGVHVRLGGGGAREVVIAPACDVGR